jgi:lauroyl/myristoyl acyltransferase
VKKLRYFIETCGVKLLAWSMPRLPRHVILVLAKVVGALGFLFDFRGRSTGVENLRAAFADKLRWFETHRIILRSYQNFARTFFDLFWVAAVTKDNWQEHFTLEDADPAAIGRAWAKCAVWVTPHFGGFELASQAWGFAGLHFTIVAQDFKNPALTEIFTEARQVSGHTVIPQASALLRLTKALQRHSNAAFLTDFSMPPGRATAIVETFGLKNCVPTLHVMLAQRLGLDIIPSICLPADDGRYVVKTFAAITPSKDDSPQAVVQQCASTFEAEIREHPELYMWMYKHWRYLPGDDTDVLYPIYANPHRAFAKAVSGK